MPVTARDIAAHANVDVNDVVKVMFQQQGVDRIIRDRILVAMHELDFPMLQNLTRVDQQTLGIIAPSEVNGEYMGAVLDGVTNVTRAAGIGTRISVHYGDIHENLPLFLSDPQIFGVVLISPDFYAETIAICRRYQMPIATFSYQDDVDLSEVLLLQTNNQQSIINAVDHLVDLNHHRIGFITGYMTHNDAKERLEGYQAGLAKHGIPYDETLVYYGDFMRNSGFDAGMALLQQNPRPTAIIASSDMMAIGVIHAAHELHLQVGKDLSIIGFDDLPIASQVTPPLTTMAQPYVAMATAAIEGLQKVANGEKLDQYQMRFEAEFIIRGSTAQVS